MKLQVFAAVVLVSCPLAAVSAERCQAISDAVLKVAAGKPSVVASLKEKPQSGPMGEAWRYLKLIFASDFTELKVPEKDQDLIFKTIADLNYSDNPEVNADIFREYYFLSCKRAERQLATADLRSISAQALVGCWDTVSSRSEFLSCYEPLMDVEAKQGQQ